MTSLKIRKMILILIRFYMKDAFSKFFNSSLLNPSENDVPKHEIFIIKRPSFGQTFKYNKSVRS
jgi:hypothetical protein